MSLRTKLLLVTALFMVIVVGLLTLNLSLDAAANRARQNGRDAQLLERLATDWVREASGPQGFVDWTDVARKLSRSSLIDNWMIVEKTDAGLLPRTHADASPAPKLSETDVRRFTDAIVERKTSATGRRVYVPIESRVGVV